MMNQAGDVRRLIGVQVNKNSPPCNGCCHFWCLARSMCVTFCDALHIYVFVVLQNSVNHYFVILIARRGSLMVLQRLTEVKAMEGN